jgi:hypothetical protein
MTLSPPGKWRASAAPDEGEALRASSSGALLIPIKFERFGGASS